MKTIKCDFTYAEQILAIFNDAILTSTALYDYKSRNMDDMKSWFEVKNQNSYPVIGIVDEMEKLLAFGSYGQFRTWQAYKYSIEHSLYVEKSHRGKGLGKIILSELIQAARKQQYHCMVAGIDSTNIASIKLHKQYNFEHCGTIKQVGFKFNSWLNLDFYQLLLDSPSNPTDG
jgi:phosphinothricin acetyltransferase